MVFPLLPIISAVAPALIGGAFAAAGQASANQEAKAASARQMEFQERMSNTQFQRGMADMKKAGLNPILAYKMGGATAPGGSTYTPGNIGAAAVQGAASAQATNRSVREQDLAKDLLGAQVDVTNQNAINLIQQRDLIRAQTMQAKASSAQAMAAAGRETAQTAILGETLQSAKAAAAVAKADEDFYKTEAGENLRKLNRLMTNLNPFVDAGTSAANSAARFQN